MPIVTSTPAARRRSLLASIAASSLIIVGLSGIDSATAPPATAHGEFGSLPTGDGPQAIAMAAGFAYIANRLDDSVTVYDTSDWSLETTLNVGSNPYNISASNDQSVVWVSNVDDGTISIIDTSTNLVIDTLSTGGRPREVIFTADDTTAYVLNSQLALVQAVNTSTQAITELGSSLPSPTYGVLSADEQQLYFTGLGGIDRVVRLDLVSEIYDYNATVPLPDSGRANDLLLSPDGTQLWATVQAESSTYVAILNPTATEVITTIPLAGVPGGFDFSATGDFVYVTEYSLDQVSLIDLATLEVVSSVRVGDEPYSVASDSTGKVAVTNFFDDTISIVGLETERLAGQSRFATAVEVSKRAFPSGANTVFLANGLNFPDALSAGPAAGLLDGSLLLTAPTSLPSVVRDELVRLAPDTIYIVGGVSAVSASVKAAVEAIDFGPEPQPTVERLFGASRYDTAEVVVSTVWDSLTVPEVFIATGRNYPDALSAGAVAAAEGVPVILVDGTRSTVPPSTLALIADLAPTQITIAGGANVVSAGIMTQLTTAFGGDVRRLSGASRYETSTAISADAYASSESVIFATGANFPDALAAASLAARANAPLYLVPKSCVTPGGMEAVFGGQATYLFLLGSESVVTADVASLSPC